VFAEIDILRMWNNPTLQLVSLGTGILGVVAGALGCFALLRKQSLLGDAVSHAALPGVMLSFLLFRSKAPLPLVLGAAVTGWMAALLAPRIARSTRLPIDTALCGVMSVFFGIGILLQSYMQHKEDSGASQAGLDRFIFGQAATLLPRDVWLMAGLGGLALMIMLLFWKELKLLSFDSDFAASLGQPVRGLNVLLTSLLVVAIVIGLQSVGVVLMSALVVAPGAAARQWTDRLGRMVALAAVFGGLSGVAGTLLSDQLRHVPTGPTIVLCATAIVIGSLLFAPRRGLMWRLHTLRARAQSPEA
jgi:manganese/zinc/iron transport system permease protein